MQATGIKRSTNRLSLRLPIFFGIEQPDRLGRLKNISAQGAAIACRQFVEPLTLLRLRLTIDGMAFDFTGQVRWSRRFALDCSFVNDCEMGVRFQDIGARLGEVLDRLGEHFIEQRREPRFEKTFVVTLMEGKSAQSLNISRNGIYIMTANPPARGSMIEVKIIVADINQTVRVEGKVQHAVHEAEAWSRGIEPGFGMVFTNFLSDNEADYAAYIQRLAAQRQGT